jgi:hypothetical protein
MWPTEPDASGSVPSVMELMLDPALARQGMYLVQAGAQLKESGHQPEGFQMPIVVAGLRTTVPLALLDASGNRAMVYTSCAPWDAFKIRGLRDWIRGMREVAGVHSSVPAIVVSQFDSTEVRTLTEVQQFLVLALLDRTSPEKRLPPDQLGPQLADTLVGLAGKAGIQLDYSPDGLLLVDQLLGTWRQGSDEDLTVPLRAAGAYVGEVIVRHLNGSWRNVEGTPIEKMASGPIVVELPGEAYCNPLGKAWKRFDQGPGDSVAFFFTGLKNRKAIRA